MASKPKFEPTLGRSLVRFHSLLAVNVAVVAAVSKRSTLKRLVALTSLSRSVATYRNVLSKSGCATPSASGLPAPDGYFSGLPAEKPFALVGIQVAPLATS